MCFFFLFMLDFDRVVCLRTSLTRVNLGLCYNLLKLLFLSIFQQSKLSV